MLFFGHFPFVVLFLLSLLLVLVLCCFFLLCQFEYRRKRYVAWKSQPSSGYTTPEQNNASKMATTSCMEDEEDDVLAEAETDRAILRQRTLERRLMRKSLHRLSRNSSAATEMRPARPCHRRRASLPESPFRETCEEQEADVVNCLQQQRRKMITATQFKRALAIKSRRYR